MSDPASVRRLDPTLEVRGPDGQIYHFTTTFDIGRDPDCEVHIRDIKVSRRHARVMIQDGRWVVCDLQSSNGVLVDGTRVLTAAIESRVDVRLGADGPSLVLEPEHPPPPAVAEAPAGGTVEAYAERYFSSDHQQQGAGERTRMIRKAFDHVQRRQRRRYQGVVAIIAVIGVCAAAYGFYAYRQISRQEAIAENLFYSMKAIDVNIARVEQMVANSGQGNRDEIRQYMEQRRQMEANYDQFVAGLYDRKLTEEERLILRVTRNLGECELAAPSDYLEEVKHYIRGWQSTGRYASAVKVATDLGYTRRITAELSAQNLPPQFFYLAMQESSFRSYVSGKPTRWGIAKGMWQFIPETGKRYGLNIGPYAGVARNDDPADDRLQWDKATHAAALYIKDLYATDAQASGLLVMASYNWGEQRIIDLLRTMPKNPRERNFWQVLAKHRDRVPKETYDYVFNIVSAAVIGENPRLFGFTFDNPLAPEASKL